MDADVTWLAFGVDRRECRVSDHFGGFGDAYKFRIMRAFAFEVRRPNDAIADRKRHCISHMEDESGRRRRFVRPATLQSGDFAGAYDDALDVCKRDAMFGSQVNDGVYPCL